MDVVIRRRRPLLIAAILARAAGLAATACAAEACAPPASGSLVGVSDRPAGGAVPRETRDGGLLDGGASLPIDYRTRFTKVNKARFVSAGHASGRWDVDVWANEAGLKALATRSRDVQVGAIVVQEHFEKSGAGGAGPVMVMEKRTKGFAPDHGDWRWTVVGSSGHLVKDGVVDTCTGCHDDAPMDGLFPIVE